MSAVEWVLVGTYSAWFLLSVARQVSWSGARTLRAVDRFHWIPKWGLFGSPTRYDYEVMFRFARHDGSFSAWETAFVAPARKPWTFFWHPAFTVSKMVTDMGNRALRIREADEREAVMNSPRFAALRNSMATQFRPPDARALQFAIFASRAFCAENRPSLMFLSDVRDL